MNQALTDKTSPLFEDGIVSGDIVVRLTRKRSEVVAAQRLRYRVFYEECGAHPVGDIGEFGLDHDAYDSVADHLIVLDKTKDKLEDQVVGTYRLIREKAARRIGRFYSAGEFSVDKMVAAGEGGLLELGRSCIHKDYRTRNVLQLLWQGIAEYVALYDTKFLFGCASFNGTNPDDIADCLSYLYHNHLAPAAYCPVAWTDPRRVEMNRMPMSEIDARAVLEKLPPLIKGYLRVGAFVGDGAIIDRQFNTIDVCIVVETALLPQRYLRHYDRKVANGQFGKAIEDAKRAREESSAA